MSIRCLVVDDNSSFREEARRLLEQQGIEIVGGAGSGDEALQQIAEIHPDVIKKQALNPPLLPRSRLSRGAGAQE
jgi:DNA-binding NarL/FixJ family response regulator